MSVQVLIFAACAQAAGFGTVHFISKDRFEVAPASKGLSLSWS